MGLFTEEDIHWLGDI